MPPPRYYLEQERSGNEEREDQAGGVDECGKKSDGLDIDSFHGFPLGSDLSSFPKRSLFFGQIILKKE
jgi:hypothetical protein